MWTERRLRAVGRRIASTREELRIASEQALHFDDVSEDARIRSLVSEAPLDDHESRDAHRSADSMRRHLDALRAELDRLEAEQDALLDRLSARRRR